MLNYECKVETKSPIKRELTISVKADSIQKYIEKQFDSLKKTAQIKGFRKGKVPITVLKQYYMQDVKSDVYSKVIRDSYIQALEENKIVAVGMPEIETQSGSELSETQPLTFTAKVEIFPDIKVKDLTKIKIERPSSEVSDEDIEKSLTNLRENHSEVVADDAASGPAKTGDFISISFSGTVNGEALDVLKGENRLVEIGSKSYMEEFEDALIGLRKGESKDFDVPFPKEFSEPKLAGQTVKFNVTVHEFKKKVLPALDDDFAKRFKMETSLELRKKVVETLKEDRERESRDKLKENLLAALCKEHSFEVPTGLVRSQLEYLIKENSEYLKRQGFTEKMIRDYLEKNTQQLLTRAEEQVRASLVIDKIAEEQKIRTEQADLDSEYAKVSARMQIPQEQVRGFYEKDDNALRQLRFRIKEDRAVEYALGQVKVTESKKKA